MKKVFLIYVFAILILLLSWCNFKTQKDSSAMPLSLVEHSYQAPTNSSLGTPLPSWKISLWQTLLSGDYYYNSDFFYLDFNDYQQYVWSLLTIKILSGSAQIDIQSRESWLWERFLLESGSSLSYPLDQWLSKYQHHVGLRAIPLSWTQVLSLTYWFSSLIDK